MHNMLVMMLVISGLLQIFMKSLTRPTFMMCFELNLIYLITTVLMRPSVINILIKNAGDFGQTWILVPNVWLNIEREQGFFGENVT